MSWLERLVRKLPWQAGRQGSGYNKLCLFMSKWLMADCYLLYFPQGSYIDPHKDEVAAGNHFRLNVMLKRATKGGEFVCADPIIRWPRLFLFRPDKSTHSVTTIEQGYRVMLSIGWVRK